MAVKISIFVCVLAFLALAQSHVPAIETIHSDFCIIGGGSSGTYAAMRLQQMGKTVTLIEKNSRLGGHVNTFSDPITGSTFDYGVIIFYNISVVTDYFKYMDVPISLIDFPPSTAVYADFAKDTVVPGSALPSGNVGLAFLNYLVQLEKYPYISNGFNLPTSIPGDLLLPWGDFLKKYDLGDMAFTVYTVLQGVGNILAQPTLYMMKYLTKQTVEGFMGAGFLSTSRHNNQELYNKALFKLGPGAFLSSNVTHISRFNDGVETLVSTPSGPKLIKSSKLIMAIQPKIENLGFLDLNYKEATLFSKFNNSYYWNAVVRHTGIPDGTTVWNMDLAAPYGIPSSPGMYVVEWSGAAGVQFVYYGSPSYISDAEVKADILATTTKLIKSLEYPASNGTMEVVELNSHSPFELEVSLGEIKNGFYDKMNALQGERNTYWTGATWEAHDSSKIWNWTEHTLLPQILG